jgi:membrane protein implicated in regulation of membrane protease activity
MSPILIWLALAVVFLLLEIATPAFLFICFTVGALFAAATALVTGSYLAQALVFAVFSIVAIPASRPLANRLSRKKGTRAANVDALVGQHAYVVEAIDPAANTGIVRVGSERWRAVANRKIEIGASVVVTNIDGVTLTVAESGTPPVQ